MSADKWVVVTGASGGIGLKTAEILMESGYKVVMTSRNIAGCEESFNHLKEGSYKAIAWDLGELDSIKDYAGKVNGEVGAVCGLVHCAGVQSILPVHMLSAKKMLEGFSVNAFAGMLLVSCFSKKNYYVENETSFVLTSSLSAHEGAQGRSVYGASKGALEGFLPSAASELMHKGIRLNIVVPGVVDAGQGKEYLDALTDDQRNELLKAYPLGISDDLDIAYMIEYLIGRKSRKITGSKIVIDGGHSVRKV